MKTYRIEIFTRTTKGKTNHIDNVFVSSEVIERDTIQKYYNEKYKPLSVSVVEVPVLSVDEAVSDQKDAVGIKKTNDSSMYSDPTYTIHRKSLPKEVVGLVDELVELDGQVNSKKNAIKQELSKYFNSGVNLSSYSNDTVSVVGRPLAFSLGLRKKDE